MFIGLCIIENVLLDSGAKGGRKTFNQIKFDMRVDTPMRYVAIEI